MTEREKITGLYVRICRDSGFSMSFDKAAHFVADMLGISALEVWSAFGDITNMQRVASGEHPAVNNRELYP